MHASASSSRPSSSSATRARPRPAARRRAGGRRRHPCAVRSSSTNGRTHVQDHAARPRRACAPWRARRAHPGARGRDASSPRADPGSGAAARRSPGAACTTSASTWSSHVGRTQVELTLPSQIARAGRRSGRASAPSRSRDHALAVSQHRAELHGQHRARRRPGRPRRAVRDQLGAAARRPVERRSRLTAAARSPCSTYSTSALVDPVQGADASTRWPGPRRRRSSRSRGRVVTAQASSSDASARRSGGSTSCRRRHR